VHSKSRESKVESGRVERRGVNKHASEHRWTLLSSSTFDFVTSRFLDFSAVSFVFIDIPGLFLRKVEQLRSRAVEESRTTPQAAGELGSNIRPSTS
jgi:hypothetical protein